MEKTEITWFKWMTGLDSDNITIHREHIAEQLDVASVTSRYRTALETIAHACLCETCEAIAIEALEANE